VPTIVLARRVRSAAVDVVMTADLEVVRTALDHLASLGHRDIAHLDGGVDPRVWVPRTESWPLISVFAVNHPHVTRVGLVPTQHEASDAQEGKNGSTARWPTDGHSPVTTPASPNVVTRYRAGCTSTTITDPTPPSDASHRSPA
jgi:hypothetical protein